MRLKKKEKYWQQNCFATVLTKINTKAKEEINWRILFSALLHNKFHFKIHISKYYTYLTVLSLSAISAKKAVKPTSVRNAIVIEVAFICKENHPVPSCRILWNSSDIFQFGYRGRRFLWLEKQLLKSITMESFQMFQLQVIRIHF